MKWYSKPIAILITGLIATLYFNVIFCEDIDRGGKNKHEILQVVNMTLSFPNVPASKNTNKSQERVPSEPIKKAQVPEVVKPVIKIKKMVERLVALPVKKTSQVRNLELVKYDSKVQTHEQDVEKNSEPNTIESNSHELQPPALVKNESRVGSAQNAGVESAMQAYMEQVRDYIAKHKRYPKEAKIRRQQGNVTISFVIDANGRVSEHKIIKSCKSRYINKSVKILLSKLKFNMVPETIRHQFPKTVVLDVNYQFG